MNIQVSIGEIPGSLSAKNKSETGSSSSRVTLVVKLLRFLTVFVWTKQRRNYLVKLNTLDLQVFCPLICDEEV